MVSVVVSKRPQRFLIFYNFPNCLGESWRDEEQMIRWQLWEEGVASEEKVWIEKNLDKGVLSRHKFITIRLYYYNV